MRIFVAGAGGVIGRRLCPLLVEEGWTVVGTTRSPSRAETIRAMGVEPVVIDVFDRIGLLRVVKEARPDVVIHQLTDLPPALDPAQMAEARVRNARLRDVGTRNLVEAAVAAGAKRLIAQSIAFAYAPGPQPYDENSPLDVQRQDDAGLSARGVARLERHVLEAPLVGIVLRYGKLYGPGTGFDDPPPGGPLHVDAAAEAARLAVTRGERGTYNIVEWDGTVSSRKAARELGWRQAEDKE
ncbi:MAG TPA: NAD(P)-dependent oxidoreductase [Longimicrobiaceae bacterium]